MAYSFDQLTFSGAIASLVEFSSMNTDNSPCSEQGSLILVTNFVRNR